MIAIEPLLHAFVRASAERPDLTGPGEVADDLGVGGVVRRLADGVLPPAPEGDALYARLWCETLLEVGAGVDGTLSDRGIPYFVYKGGALLGREYLPGDVQPSDLDFFVREEDRLRAIDALTADGWVLQPPPGGPELPGSPGAAFHRDREESEVGPVPIDVHWRADPVDRLFPWRGRGLPEPVWASIDHAGDLPRPAAGHHAALLVHHLAHHDLLHFRSFFDLAVLWPQVTTPSESARFESLSRHLGVSRLARRLAAVIETQLEDGAGDTRRAAGTGLSLDSLVTLALDAEAQEFESITLARGLRRLRTIDRPILSLPRLMNDALLPPARYLEWRWPDHSRPKRLLRHWARVVGRFDDV